MSLTWVNVAWTLRLISPGGVFLAVPVVAQRDAMHMIRSVALGVGTFPPIAYLLSVDLVF